VGKNFSKKDQKIIYLTIAVIIGILVLLILDLADSDVVFGAALIVQLSSQQVSVASRLFSSGVINENVKDIQ
jgi:hypothetical protein